MNDNNDTIAIADTQCNEQTFLSDDEQTAKLSHSSMAHFKIIDILGKGGMGAVYKAKDLALERFVAIKMIRLSKAEQPLMLTEAKTISKLNHPNIVTIYDIARDEDANFIVMEWVNGSPLNTVISSEGLALTHVLAYAKQLVAGIACAHQEGIIHRDIKPQNIMVDREGRIKILDFGIAALVEPEQTKYEHAEPKLAVVETTHKKQQPYLNAIVGSPQYMSPEQINGQAIDTRSDLFSLGIVLYEMLTGVKPFMGLNVKQITQAITLGQYTPVAEAHAENNKGHNKKYKALPAEIIAIVDKLLQVEPSARYQTAETLAEDINTLDEKINHKKNWWQQQHWLTKIFIVIPLIAMLGWSIRSVFFPPTTQELIARQLVESQKIAFLPFDNISGDPVLQIFSDGIATMLSSDLAEVGYQQGDGTTWVLPTSEIRHLEDPSVTGIYNQYGVDAIVTGSIQHMGSTRSVHLSLVNGADGRQLKSVQLSIDADNLFAARTKIREQVMLLLGWTIPPALSEKFAQQKTAFDGAYKYYLAGQGYLYRFDHGDNINNALAAFNKAIEIDAGYADAYVGLAEAQLRDFLETKDVNLLKQMETTVEKLLKLDSDHPVLSYLQGELSFNQGDYNNAVALFSKSIELNANFLKAYTGLSDSYIELGELIKSEKILLQAYRLSPNNSAILTNLGAFHYSNGDYLKAIDYFELLAEKAPNNYTAYLNISACYYLDGDFQKAIVKAKKALEIEPNFIVYSNLGTYYFMLRDYDKAVESYESMIALNKTDYINWGNLADAYRFVQNEKYIETFEHAIGLAEESLKLNSNNKYAIASLAYYYANLNNKEKSNFYASQISENDIGEDLFIIAAAYARLNINKTAIKYLDYAIKKNHSIIEITTTPLLDSLRGSTSYRDLIIKSK